MNDRDVIARTMARVHNQRDTPIPADVLDSWRPYADAVLAAIGDRLELAGTALMYYDAAQNAIAVGKANGRRGASGEAVDLVNRARANARNAHELLMARAELVKGDGGDQP
jgi:hypothetical protein